MSINSKNIVASKNFIYLEKLCLTIARKESPVDTGNMRDNAIYVRPTSNGFQIVWDNQFAYYLPIVDKNEYVTNADIAPSISSGKSRNKGTKNANLGFVHRTARKLNEVCQQYLNSPKDIYKEYANRKIDLNPKMLKQESEFSNKIGNMVENGNINQARKLMKKFYRDPKYRRFITSQKIYRMTQELEE